MRRLQATHDPARIEAEWQRLRDDMLAMLEREMLPMAERIDRLQLTSFAVVALHQRLGDLFRRLGQVADARRQFQQGHDLVSRIAVAQPRNDVARANAGLMQVRLGELDLDLDGDAARARDHFGRAWELQDEIARHPRSGQYSKADNHRLLSGIAIKQGIADLRLGHPVAARERFERALSERAAWVEAVPADLSALSNLSEAELWLGVTLSHLGDWPDARPHLEAAIEICRELSDLRPRDLSFKGDLAVVHGDYGDALARRGRYDDAGRAYERSMGFARRSWHRIPTMRLSGECWPPVTNAWPRWPSVVATRSTLRVIGHQPSRSGRSWPSSSLTKSRRRPRWPWHWRIAADVRRARRKPTSCPGPRAIVRPSCCRWPGASPPRRPGRPMATVVAPWTGHSRSSERPPGADTAIAGRSRPTPTSPCSGRTRGSRHSSRA